MEDFQSWIPTSESKSTLSEETSFSSLESSANPKSTNFHCYIASLGTLASQISCLAVNENSLYATSLNEISVFSLTNYALIDTFSCSDSASGLVKFIAFSDRKIFTAHQDCKIRVWQMTSSNKHRLISTLPTFKDRLCRCMLAKNYVQVRRHKQKLWIEHSDTVSCLAVNNGLMYSASWDKSFKTWKISDMNCLESMKNVHSDAVNAIVVSVNDLIYTASADGHIKVWEKVGKTHKLLTLLDKHTSSVNALSLKNDGSVLFSGGGDQIIFVWEREDSANFMVVKRSLAGHRGAILCLFYVNNTLLSGSSDKTIRIWQEFKEGYCCLGILEGHCKPIKSIVAVSDGDLDDNLSVFSGSLDGEIRVWNITISTRVFTESLITSSDRD
ncbi:Transducin/WD40 repeat-like superfamily protein [Abeliophyllum distichum]|uniref:Transducin/WD40 repeat-like superfamily protein n=1 Tax=Abeliophyllum distichum TaxID=126358 RepID=A0ABD1PND3_9LAMI